MTNEELDEYNMVQILHVQNKNNPDKVEKIIGVDTSVEERRLTIPDIFASVNYYLNLLDGIGIQMKSIT